MDTAKLRTIFSTRIRKLRDGKLNQGEFADSVGISRGAMSYYEQESRTPDIGVLRTICEKYDVSADYMLGLMADRNHAVSDACKVTGLSPEAVKKLNIISRLAATEFDTQEHLMETMGDDFENAMQLTPFTSITELINVLLENDEGLSLLSLLGAIVLGAETDTEPNEPPVVRIKSASKNFQIAVPIKSLTAALWVNIQEHAHDLRGMLQADQAGQETVETQPSD
jgi:transcriptional regulator with XRE-family HTH domain